MGPCLHAMPYDLIFEGADSDRRVSNERGSTTPSTAMMGWWPGVHNEWGQTTQNAGSVMISGLVLPIAELEGHRVLHVIQWLPMPPPGVLVHSSRTVYAGVPLESKIEAPCGFFHRSNLNCRIRRDHGGDHGGWRIRPVHIFRPLATRLSSTAKEKEQAC